MRRTPIDQEWIRQYVDQLLAVAGTLPEGAMRDALMKRAEHALDLVEAWHARQGNVAK